ncbi:MAG TPA: hypothetical protein VN285_10750 [Candidatus Deferrimicrobium sp.]|nr:hypothetical protein [Candidatus Deferrimicrobium sp.]
MTSNRRRYDVDPYLYLLLILTVLVCLPGFYIGISDSHVTPAIGVFFFGMAIFGGAFILSWAAEAAQIDISESLAVAILALLAVLPEYAVDFVFTWKSAHDPRYAHYAIANMTGANRLLVGLGWPLVLLISLIVKKGKAIVLDESQRVEIFYLAMATIYSFTIPLKGHLSLIDTIILVTLFGLYTRRVTQMEATEPELVGPVRIVANLGTTARRMATIFMFAFAGAVIFFVAEPFAESLVSMGRQFGINEFLLVQWLAPIASESPEFIVACTWAARGAAGSALKALISSKVNQWTLLVGTIPLVYAISGRAVRPFMLDTLQDHELLLTAAQSVFAVAVLVNLKLGRSEGILLFVLFMGQLIVEKIRMEVAAVYILLALGFHIKHWRHLIPAARIGLGLKQKKRH